MEKEKEKTVSYHAPKIPAPEKPQPPLFRADELRQARLKNQNKSGYLSTYLQQSTAPNSNIRMANYLSSTQNTTLGGNAI